MTELRTDRLLLRQWTDADRVVFAELNADPDVMEHFPATLSREQSDDFVDRMSVHLAKHGWGLWAVEVIDDEEFIGFVGLWPIGFNPFPGEDIIEVGWRLTRTAWGHGYATEAATVVLEHAFDVLGLDEVVSVTAATNRRSVAVMERIGMTRDPASDFEHVQLPEGHPLRPHVVYRARAETWGSVDDT